MNAVDFREFEERDADFVLKCKNDAQLNSRTVGAYKPMTREEAVRWVQGCMGEHPTYKYWAVCTNDEEHRIVGWISLSQIDKVNQSACFHGILIGDPDYRDGSAWIESYLFIFEYVFEILNLNRLYGSRVETQGLSGIMGTAMHFKTEGVAREAVFRDGRYMDVLYGAVLRREYLQYKAAGEYTYERVRSNILRIVRERKKQAKRKSGTNVSSSQKD